MRSILRKGSATCVFLMLLLGSGARAHAQDLTKLATDLAVKIRAKSLERVTVVDFLDLDQKSNKLTKFMTLQLQSALTEANLEVVDQGHIAELFDQMDKLSQGLIDPTTARQLGKIAGTDVVVYGTVMVSSLSVRLDVSAIDLQTAKVIASGTASPKRFGMIDKLASQVEPQEDIESEEQPASVKVASSKQPTRIRRDQGFVFELNGCSLSGDAVTCELTVTSEGRDRLLSITNYSSRAWNDSGEEFKPDDLRVSNSQDDDCIRKQILRDVPTNMMLTFNRFGGDSSTVERLRLGWSEKESCWGERTSDFEKIALSEASTVAHSKKTGSAASAANAVGSKKGGGLLGRLTDKILDTAATTVEKIIDDKAKKLTGEDDEDPPQK